MSKELSARLTADKVSHQKFKTWKTIKIGGLKTADNFRKTSKKDNFFIRYYANSMLDKVYFNTEEKEVELVVVSVAELGFKSGAKREDIYKRASELGLDLCPAEVGPELRLQYGNQQIGEYFVIAMEPIAVSDGFLSVFSVHRDRAGRRWLDDCFGGPGHFWYDNRHFVFLRRKSS
jgi:hypothetical protein